MRLSMVCLSGTPAMSNQLEWTCEEYFKQLFGLNPTIADIIPVERIRHFDDDDQADENGLIIQAVQGERRLDGARGAFDVELHVMIKSFSLASDADETVADAIVDSVYDPSQVGIPELSSVRDRLSYLLILDEMTGERTNTKQSRKREKIFPLIAKGA